MTQEDALQSLSTFAPDWYHAVEYRISYNAGKLEPPRYVLFTMPNIHAEVGMFFGTDLVSLVSQAKNFIYQTRTEQTLTQSA